MKKSLFHLFSSMMLCITYFQPLHAEDERAPQTKPQTPQEQARVRIERTLSPKEHKEEQQARKKVADANKAVAKKASMNSSSTLLQKSAGLLYNPSYYKRPLYQIKDIGWNGKTLSLHDESIWEISDSSAATARSWAPGTCVIIIPNSAWFSSKTYRLENASNGSSVAANLSQGPLVKHAIFISYIDYVTHTIALTDNSTWFVSPDYLSLQIFNTWKIGQAILIGERRGWFGWMNGHILINVNENSYVPVNSYK